MPAVTFSRRHYRFILRLSAFIFLSGLLIVLIFRKGDDLSNIDVIQAKAAWIKDSVFLKNKEDEREFWEVINIEY